MTKPEPLDGVAVPSEVLADSRNTSELPTPASDFSTPAKRSLESNDQRTDDRDSKRRKGVAPVKEAYLVHDDAPPATADQGATNDDNAEASHHVDRQPVGQNTKGRGKSRGQNKNRKFDTVSDEIELCPTRHYAPELSPQECSFGDRCKFEHDLRKYLSQHKSASLATFDGVCPVWNSSGRCEAGWKCRFVESHSKEVERKNGKRELILVEEPQKIAQSKSSTSNNIGIQDRIALTKKKYPTPKSDVYLKYLDESSARPEDQKRPSRPDQEEHKGRNSSSPEADNRSNYIEPPLLSSEKTRLYFGPETPVLAPLTTQGNLPFRRLCVSLGATFTYSEMAMSFPLLQGHKPEWALIKAHSSELEPPTFTTNTKSTNGSVSTGTPSNVVYDYDQSKDLKFGAQISASKPWTAIRAAETLTALLPNGLRCIDLNCGCPIDLVFREGAGSALMNSPNKLSKIIHGMNTVSGSVPITCKIRMGTKDNHPTAQKLVERLVLGSRERGGNSPPSGVAAITLHGRSRQQRYTRSADWDYISQTSELVAHLNKSRQIANGTLLPPSTPESDLIASLTQKVHDHTDTTHAPDPRDQPAQPTSSSTTDTSNGPPLHFLGNGDIYSPHHYHTHLTSTHCSTLMLARGALIKPWLFAELASPHTPDMGLTDPRSSERLALISTFVANGLAHWGSDTRGVATTRKFLLDWLSFTHRYVPVGLLEVLPAELNDRAPRFRARDEMEQLLASEDVRDWMKISEMFLGKTEDGFRFVPKHKSNAVVEAEG